MSDVEEARRALRQMTDEHAECQRVLDRLADILTRTANALHGGPLKDGMWSWHDLPELVERLRAGDDPVKDVR